ncbi:MAG: GNAT family N-acetyltransferase [Acidobacteriota bacterium]
MDVRSLVEILAWDSDHFGCRIARVVAKRLTPDLGRQILERVDEEKVDCLYFLAESADQGTVRVAEDLGFRLVDIRLRMEADKAARSLSPRDLPPGISIRPAVEEDLPGLRELSRDTFRHSRFYRDPNFPDTLCDALYEQWIENVFTAESGFVLVAGAPGEPVGYTAGRLQDGVGEFDLLSVAPVAQARGLGQVLVERGIRWFFDAGAERVFTVTQGQNLRTQRVAMRAGIFPIGVEVWYHRWSRDSQS